MLYQNDQNDAVGNINLMVIIQWFQEGYANLHLAF